ncbi:phytanoyl-CoA dioxygenase [Klebsiella pneumoniae]|uniref:phytanoyl-CoA dioxygenase n=1 Tax=Klebsiella pneumoniae TaxID=573 RepID=UPI003A103AF9
MLSRGPLKNIPLHIKRVSTALNAAVHWRNNPGLYKSGNTLISFLVMTPIY